MNHFQDNANFVWQLADDLLRGTFKENEYGEVTLPFLVLRRLDCVLESTKEQVIETHKQFMDASFETKPLLLNQAEQGFYNTSPFDLQRLSQDAQNIEANFNHYLSGYSDNVREILENYEIDKIVAKLVRNDLLFLLVDRFTEIDLHPNKVSNHEMGYIFEELLRRFSEMSNETAGEHYTPREVIQLMVNLLFAESSKALQGTGIIRTVYDPACGTGGMLTTAKKHIQENINAAVTIDLYGQESNEQTYAISKSDILISGGDAENIVLGSSFSKDGLKGNQFNFMLSNPPFGVSWKKEQAFIKAEANDPHGRFHAGLPRISDGALLFLQHMISKMEPQGSRIAIIFNGSPLFTGDAGSGESNIRKWIIENDWLEGIVALPNRLFFNTSISTYIWILTNKKSSQRSGKIQLIDGSQFYEKTKTTLGNKMFEISDKDMAEIRSLYLNFQNDEKRIVKVYDKKTKERINVNRVCSKIFPNQFFGFTKVTVERPLKDANGEVVRDKQGHPKPDSSLRDSEKIPLNQDIDDYFSKEVLPHVPDAWMDRSKDKVGYEINFTKYFYQYQPLRPLETIEEDLRLLETEAQTLMQEILGR